MVAAIVALYVAPPRIHVVELPMATRYQRLWQWRERWWLPLKPAPEPEFKPDMTQLELQQAIQRTETHLMGAKPTLWCVQEQDGHSYTLVYMAGSDFSSGVYLWRDDEEEPCEDLTSARRLVCSIVLPFVVVPVAHVHTALRVLAGCGSVSRESCGRNLHTQHLVE